MVTPEPELMFCEDGSVLEWLPQDGQLFLGINDAEESHQHRIVLEVEDLAPMLLRTMSSAPEAFEALGPKSRAVMQALREFVVVLDMTQEDAW